MKAFEPVDGALQAERILALGDSNCLLFANLVFRQSERLYSFHAKYCPGLGAGNFADERGLLNRMIYDALEGDGYARHGKLEGRGQPLVVFAAGGIDAFVEAAGTETFERFAGGLPYDNPLFDHNLAARAWEVALAFLRPLFAGLTQLSLAGFRVILHAQPPPLGNKPLAGAEDEDAAARIRWNATRYCNWAREHLAFQAGVETLNTSELVASNGVAASDFVADEHHFNRHWAETVAQALLERLAAAAPASPFFQAAGVSSAGRRHGAEAMDPHLVAAVGDLEQTVRRLEAQVGGLRADADLALDALRRLTRPA